MFLNGEWNKGVQPNVLYLRLAQHAGMLILSLLGLCQFYVRGVNMNNYTHQLGVCGGGTSQGSTCLELTLHGGLISR